MSGLNAFGTVIGRGNGAAPTEVFTALANCTSIKPPGLSRDTIDVTAHDSPDAWKEFLGGLKDGGEFSTDVNYDPDDHDTLVDDFDDTEPRNYKFTFPNGAVWAIKALITGFEPNAPHDGKLAASLKWKVSGKPVLTPADEG